MKYQLEEGLRGATDEEVLEDLRRCAKSLSKQTITMAEYAENGKAHPSTLQRRFGSWVKALEAAGLAQSRSRMGITNPELFENIQQLWEVLGRQPRYSEVKAPISKFSAGTYENRFGTWSNALREFIVWVSAMPESVELDSQVDRLAANHEASLKISQRRTKREISDRQRFRILVRDGFRCASCGASPLLTRGVALHVDHIVPWSKGGETVDENLEVKCLQCNLGKGNAFEV